MKTKLLNSVPVLLFVFLVQFGCTSSGSEKNSILSQPPYAAITDSIKQFPDNAGYYLARAILLSQNNLHEIATADYRKAWELNPDEAVALEYASNLRLLNKTEAALLFLNECRKQYPKNSEFGRRLSELYAESGRRKEALAEYDKLIEQDSLNFMAWYERGLLLSILEDTAEAISALERSYQIQPINYTGLALANIYSAQQNPRILVICDDILSRDSTGEIVDALMLKGIYYSDKKDYKTALELFEECIRRDWKFTQAHIEKGIIFFDQKDFPNALEAFKLAANGVEYQCGCLLLDGPHLRRDERLRACKRKLRKIVLARPIREGSPRSIEAAQEITGDLI
jgi:tetratricopeptide (TPR) repeat protein